MASVKKQYQKYGNAYSEGETINNQRNQLAQMYSNVPQYQDSYADTIENIYGQIKNNKPFEYNVNNDVAFRRFADEYNALSGLAMAGNQAQAQGLTGGYGSTYAADVANQGLARMRESVNDTQPMFYQAAQQAYMADNDRLMNMYQAASSARADELSEYAKQANAWQDRYNDTYQKYSDNRNMDYQQYADNQNYWAQRYWNDVEQQNYDRNFEFKKYDTYEKLAANKCADYKEAQNNSGMRAYLDGLVEKGKLTKYMADNLYKQYKYEAPKRSSGGGSGRRSGGSGGGGYTDEETTINEALKSFEPDEKIIKYINLNNRKDSIETAYEWVDSLRNSGKIGSDEEAQLYKYYYRNLYEKKYSKKQSKK